MIISFHGGMCCGIKTIHSMGTNPAELTSSLEAQKSKRNHDANYDYTKQDYNFFTDEAPKETQEARFTRYLDFIKKYRPGHIVEVALVVQGAGWVNQKAWVPILEALGFKAVTSAKNSNSGNTVTIFHLVVDEDGQSEGEDDDEEDADEDDNGFAGVSGCDCSICVAARATHGVDA